MLRRLRSDPRPRNEVAWIIAEKTAQFIIVFAWLKLCTGMLSQKDFGELNLALSMGVVIASLSLAPVRQAYLRHYHAGEKTGEARSSGLILLKWYAAVTVGVLLAGALLARPISKATGIGVWTAPAMGLFFLTNQWRMLGTEVLMIRRERRASAIRTVCFLLGQLGLAALAFVLWQRTAAAVLIASAIVAVIVALTVIVPMIKRLRAYPAGVPSTMTAMIVPFGVPYGLLLVCQWVQSFADRYVLAGFVDLESVGLYTAAFQLCGVPYMLMLGVLHALLTPIAYQRGVDVSEPRQLWSADKVLLAGFGVYAALGILGILLYGLAGRPLLVLATNEQYALPVHQILLLATARFLQCFLGLCQVLFAVHKRVFSLLALRGLGAALTLAISWIAVSRYGLSGAITGSAIAALLCTILVLFGPNGCFWLVYRNRKRATQA
ncbi:MAG: lipopolysaccharide biosynthesis protein [Planctomycetota bacterium]